MAKRMTADQKQSKLLQLIEYNNMYHIKELEKMAIKADIKSSAKEVIDFLLAENFIKQEKIGISNIFWKKPENEKLNLEKLKSELKCIKSEILEVINKIKDRKDVLNDEENIKKNGELSQLENEFKKKEQTCNNSVTESDYLKVSCLVDEYRKKSNLITDNIFSVISFLKNKGKENGEIFKTFNIPEDFDYV